MAIQVNELAEKSSSDIRTETKERQEAGKQRGVFCYHRVKKNFTRTMECDQIQGRDRPRRIL
jgi:hypothetical protein